MKKIYTFIIAIICIGMVCGAFYYITNKGKNSAQDSEELTVVQKIITKDIEADYPATPREVVKLYNKIITCYYSAEFEEGEFDGNWKILGYYQLEDNPSESEE